MSNFTILKYEQSNGKMKPKVVKAKQTDKAFEIYEIETAKIIKDGYKLVSFVKQGQNKNRVFRKKSENLILKIVEVL